MRICTLFGGGLGGEWNGAKDCGCCCCCKEDSCEVDRFIFNLESAGGSKEEEDEEDIVEEEPPGMDDDDAPTATADDEEDANGNDAFFSADRGGFVLVV